MTKNKFFEYLIQVAMVCIFSVIVVIVISKKQNFYVDELYSYGLSNSFHGGMNIAVQDGETYFYEEPYEEYLTVAENQRLSYVNVWNNQKMDVHPPLYYAILHSICSFFLTSFSKWYASLINWGFAILTAFLIKKMVFYFTNSQKAALISMLGFYCTAGILEIVTFLRMYVLAMFFVCALTFWHLKMLDKEKVKVWDAIVFVILAVLGALTHYYVIIFLFFEACYFGGVQIFKKSWRKLGSYLLACLISGGLAILIFPPMLEHIFGGNYRGKQSFSNLLESNQYFYRIKLFGQFLSEELTGFPCIAFLIVLGFGVVAYLKANQKDRNKLQVLGTLMVPCVLYFFLIAKIAVMKESRYLFPIYGNVLCLIYFLLYQIYNKYMEKKASFLMLVSVVFLACVSLVKCDWKFLYLNDTRVKMAKEYAENDCIYIYDNLWKAVQPYRSIGQYHSMTFYALDNYYKLTENTISEEDHFVVYLASEGVDQETILQSIEEMGRNVNSYQLIYQEEYADVYYFE